MRLGSALTSAKRAVCWGLVLVAGATEAGCQKKLTQGECELLLDRYVEFLVRAEVPKMSASKLLERKREARELAKESAAFGECSSAVSARAFECAMSAPGTDELEKCLL